MHLIGPGILVALICALLSASPAMAAGDDEIAELKRTLRESQAQTRELARRLSKLESSWPGTSSARKQPSAKSQRSVEQPATQAIEPPPEIPQASPSVQKPPSTAVIEQRVRDLEMSQTAQESATRGIIQSALSKLGPRINEFVSLGGSLEVLAGRQRDFAGATNDSVKLNTVELDFDLKLSNWATGSLIVTHDSGQDVLFATTTGFDTGVDRFRIDRGVIRLGDVERFPLFVRAGREVIPFGSSTGVHRADLLSITNPLTIEAFETRENAVGIGFAFPTPALGPPPRPVIIPPVRPLVVAPLVELGARGLGYQPLPQRPQRLVPVAPPVEPPPFYGMVQVYEGTPNVSSSSTVRLIRNVNASVGYRADGHCGVTYEALRDSLTCPWSLDAHVDFNTSVFNSAFLQSGYRQFLRQFGFIPGLAATAKLNMGPFALVGEFNGAIERARFLDDAAIARNIQPMAWQASLGYQFDWNPWLETLGSQGDFLAIGYSRSSDLAGVTSLGTGARTRVGFAPESRFFISAAEWVMDGVKWQIEYAMDWDYARNKGGTGNIARGLFSTLTLNF